MILAHVHLSMHALIFLNFVASSKWLCLMKPVPSYDREGNAPPLQGCPILPGRGRAHPLVDPHRLASPPGSPEAEALNSEEARACVRSIPTSFSVGLPIIAAQDC